MEGVTTPPSSDATGRPPPTDVIPDIEKFVHYVPDPEPSGVTRVLSNVTFLLI